MFKRIYKSLYNWLFPEPVKEELPKELSSEEKLNNAVAKVQEGIDEVEALLMHIFCSWDKTFVVEMKEGRKVHKFDLSNPTTKEEFERKKRDGRALCDFLVQRWLLKKSYIPFKKSKNNFYGEYMGKSKNIEDDSYFIMRRFVIHDSKDLKMNVASSQPYTVDIPKEQIEAWNRLRKIYFPDKENHEVSK